MFVESHWRAVEHGRCSLPIAPDGVVAGIVVLGSAPSEVVIVVARRHRASVEGGLGGGGVGGGEGGVNGQAGNIVEALRLRVHGNGTTVTVEQKSVESEKRQFNERWFLSRAPLRSDLAQWKLAIDLNWSDAEVPNTAGNWMMI